MAAPLALTLGDPAGIGPEITWKAWEQLRTQSDFAFAIIAMAIGVIFGRERIKGSCGGIAALDNPDVTPECSLCSRAAECDDLKKAIKNRAANEP